MNHPRSCVSKDGKFIVGIHTPQFFVKNFRTADHIGQLGRCEDGSVVDNQVNFPTQDLHEPNADTIYEIANPFSFRGTTYINSAWADAKAANPDAIKIPEPPPCSFLKNMAMDDGVGADKKADLIACLPHPLRIALAQASTDPEELCILATQSCKILFDESGSYPVGIGYIKKKGHPRPDITDHELFEVLVNNPYLPDEYKDALVLKPGVQGTNEITADYMPDNNLDDNSGDNTTHVFEYLRRNSYIPWGHFASNMANDAIRYAARDLSQSDMTGIRHLYYQRAYARLAQSAGIELSSIHSDTQGQLSVSQMEELRIQILSKIQTQSLSLDFNATLWGWNFGFGYAQSGHRLHASHQMIHQQNAMIPRTVATNDKSHIPSFACGDMITEFIGQYKLATGNSFFETYINAIRTNTRTDSHPDRPSSLIVSEDEHTLLFVPKAQISEWELQLMPKTACGNILQADTLIRQSLDKHILLAVQVLEQLGAKMVTSIEFSSRVDSPENDQHLLYSFIPRLPYAPGTFSEAQLRWISGLYPEDFALACRNAVAKL